MVSKTVRLANNAWSVKYFAIALGLIMVLFTLYHWANLSYLKFGPKTRNSVMEKLIRTRRYEFTQNPFSLSLSLTARRKTSRCLVSSVFNLQIGRWALYIVYWAINVILIVTNVEYSLKYVRQHTPLVDISKVADYVSGCQTSRMVRKSNHIPWSHI